ncbi:hypothetical protein [Rhodocaloribacter sp.]
MRSNGSIQHSYFRFSTSGILLLAFGICIGAVGSVSAQEITDVIEWTDSLNLEEPDGIFTVSPEVRIDPRGGFIVTDFKESQVRLYTRSGKLKTYFGEKGTQAPGALRGPVAALRLSSGRILVPELLNGNLSLFGEDGTFLKRHIRVVAGGTNRVQDLPGEDVLLIGTEKLIPGSHPLLHRFHPETGNIRRSFFPHPIPLGSYENYLFTVGKIATADVRDDTIVAAFALLNRLYFFDLDGNLKREVELPLSHFRKMEKPDREVDSREIVAREAKEHSRAQNVFWLDDRIILFQYYDSTDLFRGGIRWKLAAVTPEGEVLFDIADTPQLFTVDPKTQELFFSHPDHDFENYWIVGRLRSQVVQAANGTGRR